MKSMQYALADLYYYKRSTLLFVTIFSLFLLLLNFLSGLIAINRQWIEKLQGFSFSTETIQTYKESNENYFYIYIGILTLYVGLLVLISCFEIKRRKEVTNKWCRLGFSNFYIMKQVILEILITIGLSIVIVSLFLVVFQNIYEDVLFRVHASTELGLPFWDTQSVIISSNVPKTSDVPVYQTSGIFSIDLHTIDLSKLFSIFSFNLLILSSILLVSTIIFTGYGIYQSKYALRT